MDSKIQLGAKGLVLAPGELSKAPGSLIVADNVNVEAPGVIRSRQGFAKQANGFGGPAWKFVSTKLLDTNLLLNFGSGTVATGLRYGDGSAATTLITGTVTNQPATRMQIASSQQNHYLTSDEGVRRLESSNTLWGAGMPDALGFDLSAGTVLSGAPGVVIPDTYAVAYRLTWCKKDQQGVVIEGPVSSRTVVYNNTRTTGWVTGVTKNVTLRVILPSLPLTAVAQAPSNLTTDFFYRLYRSKDAERDVAGINIPPSDEMAVVAQAYLVAADITAGYVDITDSTPEEFRALGDPLYTNTLGGDSTFASNEMPPRARDVVLFSDCMFYGDLTYRVWLEFTILSTVSGTGLTAADTITIGGQVFTAIVPGAPANNEFVVATVAAGSQQGEALERTALNLVRAINLSTTNTTLWASYESDPDALTGKIRVTARQHDYSFGIVSSLHGNAYRPQLGAVGFNAPGQAPSNAIAFSKPALPNAVPFLQTLFVGSKDSVVLRLVVLGESIFAFTDAGIYRLTGSNAANFAVQEFDLTFRLLGRELICVCDDAIYAWGHEGIAKITTGGGVQYISNAIEPRVWASINDLKDATTGKPTWLAAYGWATAYRSRHKVMFAIPESTTKGNSPTVLVYDTRMEAWTRWSFTAAGDVPRTWGHACGTVRIADDLLFLGQWNVAGNDSYIYKERRTYAATDYRDDTLDASNIAITKTVTWSAATASPDRKTHWHQLHLFWDVSDTFAAMTTPTALVAYFASDRASSSSNVTVAPTATDRMSRCGIPQTQRRSVRLTVTVQHATAGEYFGLEGMALVHRPPESFAGTKT